LDIGKILNAYYERPYGTRLKTDYAFWTNRNTNGFNINGRVRYAPYKIMYVPAFWEQFKWGWIQYIAVLIPFLYVFRLIKIFIFENQLVPVIVMASPNKVKTN
jgi:transmembrane protein 231